MNIIELFYTAAKEFPQKAAIIQKGESVTYQELAEMVQETAAYYRSKGIQRGDRVLIFVPMSIDLYRSVLALFHIGATAVFLDEWVSKERMELCCKIADCKAFIGIWKARALTFVSKELRKIPIKLGTKIHKAGKLVRPENMSLEETALITFTTGSTGTPKAANRTNGFLKAQFDVLVKKIDPQPGDVDMPVLPIVLLINLGAGATSVIADFKASKPSSLKPEKIYRQIIDHRVTSMTASPFLIKALAEYLIGRSETLPRIKKVFTGGAAVFPEEAAIYTQAFPQSKTLIIYGSTEAEPISSINVNELIKEKKAVQKEGLKVGKPETPTKIIRILDTSIKCKDEAELRQYEVPTGEIGEIIVSGDHVLKSYINNPEALKRNKIFIGGKVWHRTGDGGRLNEKGELYLTGRCKQMIHHKGKYLAPFLHEYFLQTLPGVNMGTIIKLDDELHIIIEAKANANRTKITSMIPQMNLDVDWIQYVKRIPRDPRHNSKIEYAKLPDTLNHKTTDRIKYVQIKPENSIEISEHSPLVV